MRCPRCDGLMVRETYYGHCETHEGWKCISCGEVIDPIILKNRFAHSQRFGASSIPTAPGLSRAEDQGVEPFSGISLTLG